MIVYWTKCVGDQWCRLMDVNLEHPAVRFVEGVYVIWSGPETLYVGQGRIVDRLEAHRRDPTISRYYPFVTWAAVDGLSRNGVERYLATSLRPVFGVRHPTVPPIRVNLPA